jgi:pimeloyl-ACP methyl ester carboxylesterase
MTKDDMSRTMASKAPSLLWTLAEGRSLFELNSFYALRLLMKRLPKGDGHPVIALPGFVASDRSTQPMRRLLTDLGYSTYGWGLGRNLKFDDQREGEMQQLLKTVHEREGKKVTLIGWSLGGVFARELAKHNPDAVRGVISLGSPISGDMDQTSARRLYEFMNGAPNEKMKQRLATLSEAPPVPTTSVYSKTDGIVAWRGSIQKSGDCQTENIRVPASHTGLGVNPLVMYILADRLAQAQGEWAPFEAEGFKRFLYRK